MNFNQYKVNVPLGKKGIWTVENFTVSQKDADFFNLRCSINNHGMGYRGIEPGTYTRLMREHAWDPMMSDTPAEISDHYCAIQRAKGNILINGLGIGVVLNACLMKPEVTHCTVVELDKDVIALVAPHYEKMYGARLTIFNADAMKFTPPKGTKYDMIWNDIWPSICSDNLKDIRVLKPRYKKYLKAGGWQGCWVEDEVKGLAGTDY